MAYRRYEGAIGRVYMKSAFNNPRNSPMTLSTTAPPSWSLSNTLAGYGSSSSITTSLARITTFSSSYLRLSLEFWPGSPSLYQWVGRCGGHGLARDPLHQPRESATPGIEVSQHHSTHPSLSVYTHTTLLHSTMPPEFGVSLSHAHLESSSGRTSGDRIV